MRFKQYFRKRRKQLKKGQKDFMPDYTQSYISRIENGKYPQNEDTYKVLARHLKLDEEKGGDFLWMYARFDEDPRVYLTKFSHIEKFPGEEHSQQTMVYDNVLKETNNHYLSALNLNKIEKGASPAEVQRILGPPDDYFQYENQEKWIYERKAIHVIFTDGKVSDLKF